MDVSTAIQAKSDQLNAIDLAGGPVTVRILEVREGNADQPVNIITDMFGPSRPFKPSKTVLRVLVAGWNTTDTTAWVGRSVTLYRDPAVRWAGEQVGGIRVCAMSHLDKPLALMLPTSKGKTAKSTIQVLPDAPAPVPPTDWLSELATAGNDPAALNALGHAAKNAGAGEDVLGQIRAAYEDAKEAANVQQ
jgi:hypothetical protein